MTSFGGGAKYTPLKQEFDLVDETSYDGPSSSNNVADYMQKQERIIRQQDDDLELVGKSMSTLKGMSSRIGAELEQQSVMLDELGEDMDRVDSKLNGVMKKIAKLTNLEDDTRQCKAIIILSIILFFLVFLLIVL
ncbi:syx-6 [Pristionchus pacificus]|uniref:t-SNARE coiled-coil homology domain-containing protein n=1 Tax=Pristionchus pacificus TaxID=54126 RepID=A0A8R1ZBZ6_PRIPA|nr:syx-6 [Pristionchus pacificus]